MEHLKEPSVVVSVGTLSALLGVCLYGYRQMEALRQDITTIDASLNNVVNRLMQVEKNGQASTDVLRVLHEQHGKIKKVLADVPTMDDFVDMNDDLDEIIATLKENNMSVERPSQTPQLKFKSKRECSRSFDHYRGKNLSKRDNLRMKRDDQLYDNDEDLIAAGNFLTQN